MIEDLSLRLLFSVSAAINLMLMVLVILFSSMYNRNAKELKDANKKNEVILSQKKSSETRLGKIGEHMAPFLECWPYDPNNFRFLGSPVDGIQYNDDAVIFVEIKTGGSRLSKSQKSVKELVKAGKVYFETFRIDCNGAKLTREDTQ